MSTEPSWAARASSPEARAGRASVLPENANISVNGDQGKAPTFALASDGCLLSGETEPRIRLLLGIYAALGDDAGVNYSGPEVAARMRI
jgi:hypothetical protein